MSSDLTPEEARKMYLASLAYFKDGEHLKPKEPTSEPATTIYPTRLISSKTEPSHGKNTSHPSARRKSLHYARGKGRKPRNGIKKIKNASDNTINIITLKNGASYYTTRTSKHHPLQTTT